MPVKPASVPRPAARQTQRGPGVVRIIGGHLKRSKLVVANHPGLRPTPDRVRETLFNWLGQDLTGRRCLDLFAGSGVLGLEAASRGAVSVDLVERDTRLAKLLADACARLGVAQAHVHVRDALQFAAGRPDASYDLVFIDPPFAQAASGLHANALAAAARLLPAGGQAYLETPDAHLLETWTTGADWTVQRQDRAGAVHYALLQRLPSEATSG